jgi:Protein of unknown function (DUF1353)
MKNKLNIMRRNFNLIAICNINFWPLLSYAQSNEISDSYPDKILADRWMTIWNETDKPITRAPFGALRLFRFADPMWAVDVSDIGWYPETTDSKNLLKVTVPRGFVTDFATIPRIFWSLMPRDGKYAFAAIVHDYLYWEQNVSRENADYIFKALMIDFKVSESSIIAIYNAVRLFGGRAWDENKKLKERGEKRVLLNFPNSSLIMWEDWKKNVINFK